MYCNFLCNLIDQHFALEHSMQSCPVVQSLFVW